VIVFLKGMIYGITRQARFIYQQRIIKFNTETKEWTNHHIDRSYYPHTLRVDSDDNVWFARLHADSIGKIDPKTDEIKMYNTPFKSPRRLRINNEGGIWIAAFPESHIVRFDQEKANFEFFDLPVKPLGSETPYLLNVDHKRSIVWVNGNTSDALHAYYYKEKRWQHYPVTKKVTFTRDVEIAPNGTVYTTNSSFPSWHIENVQPTLMVSKPSFN
jgi:virginiamycin B lyase